MKEELGLTEKQAEKIFDIGSEYREKYFKNRDNYENVQTLRVEHKRAIENVLTKSQKEKYNKFN